MSVVSKQKISTNFMPIALERKLKKEAKKKHLSKKRMGAYVYGTMRKQGWKPKREMKKHQLV